VLGAGRSVVVPQAIEVARHFERDRRVRGGLERDVRFEIVVADVAAGEVGRAERGDEAIAALNQRELRVVLLAVRAIPAHLDLLAARGDQLVRDRAVRHAVLLPPERIAIRIQDQPHAHASCGRREQSLHDSAIGDVERRDSNAIAVARLVQRVEQMIANRFFRDE
jgi:hypothetical protein